MKKTVHCKCKTGCRTGHCICYKNNEPCDEKCGCTGCHNKTTDMIRERYLHEYKYIHDKGRRLAFFEEIGESAVATGDSNWEKFSNGMSALLRKELKEALGLFGHAIELDHKFPHPWYGKGLVFIEQKRYDEALDACDKAIALDPELPHPLFQKGNVLIELKRYDEALDACDKAIALDPELPQPWFHKAVALKEQKHYDKALDACDKAIALNPKLPHPWFQKGNLLIELKRYNEALDACDKAIALDPNFPYPLSLKGFILKEQKHYGKALDAIKKAIALDPDKAEAGWYSILGTLYWLIDKPRYLAAEKAFRRSIMLGLDPAYRRIAEAWIVRIKRRIKSKEAGESDEKLDKADKSSDEAIVTDLFEKLMDDLTNIWEKKEKFTRQIKNEVEKSKLFGKGAAGDMLLVLRDWNSYTPILRRKLRAQVGPGPDERLGGGYFLVWKGHGIVIDPGIDFVTQLYRKGLSIADVNTVIITHCHLDHTRDVESLVDLNYRYNRARGVKPFDDNFRQLKFRLCGSGVRKYETHLKKSGCCLKLEPLRIGKEVRVTDFIYVKAISVQHDDVYGNGYKTIGLVFVLKDESEQEVVRVGFTSDTRWFESLSGSLTGCNVVVAHMGTIEVGEKTAATSREGEDTTGAEGFLEADLDNHLGTKGCYRLLQRVEPRIFIVGEFGEELTETRFKILQVINHLKPENTRLVLGADSNLTIGLGNELSVCCSHPKCSRSWTPIPLDQVHPVLGGDLLFQYFCPKHGMLK